MCDDPTNTTFGAYLSHLPRNASPGGDIRCAGADERTGCRNFHQLLRSWAGYCWIAVGMHNGRSG